MFGQSFRNKEEEKNTAIDLGLGKELNNFRMKLSNPNKMSRIRLHCAYVVPVGSKGLHCVFVVLIGSKKVTLCICCELVGSKKVTCLWWREKKLNHQ